MVLLENCQIKNMDNIPLLTQEYIKKFVRDSENDIIYNPEEPETKELDTILFYYIDYKDNKIFACNRKQIQDNVNIFKYKRHYGCLTFFL